MNRDDIIKMAREACYPDSPFRQFVGGVDCGLLMKDEHLERFFHVAQAAEREACLKLCDARHHYFGYQCAEAIRARGKS